MDVAISLSKEISRSNLIRRALGIVYGFGNQVLFLYTVWYLFWFMRDGGAVVVEQHAFLMNTGLAILFAFTHSIMLVPKMRKILGKWIPAPFYDSTFCVATCVSLLLLFREWRSSEVLIWNLDGISYSIVRGGFYLSWIALVYSLMLTGLGYQTGWTPFYYWLRHEKLPRREFHPRGAYQLMRHPVYLSFLGLLWAIPSMSLDRFVLCIIWTAYIFYGSFLKDKRLEFFIGEPYRKYQQSVPGYPLINSGPLGKRRALRNESQVDRVGQ